MPVDNLAMLSALRSAVEPADLRPARPPAAGGTDFAGALKSALQGVDNLQLDADAEARKQATGAGNLHETALAMEKADVALRLAVKARNKAVDAYQEVMRMSI